MRFALRQRYGLVLLATVVALFLTIALPEGKHTPAVLLGLQGGVLVLALIAAPPESRGHATQAAAFIAVVTALAGALGGVTAWLVLTTSAVFLLASIAALARGTFQMLQSGGVTAPVVSAALAIYVLVGLLFATTIGAIADATHAAYFAQGGDGSHSDRVYYSFTTLTTTGFGDFTPALPVGRALGVAEMLLGQIYLVTIVALLIGNLRRRPTPEELASARSDASE